MRGGAQVGEGVEWEMLEMRERERETIELRWGERVAARSDYDGEMTTMAMP